MMWSGDDRWHIFRIGTLETKTNISDRNLQFLSFLLVFELRRNNHRPICSPLFSNVSPWRHLWNQFNEDQSMEKHLLYPDSLMIKRLWIMLREEKNFSYSMISVKIKRIKSHVALRPIVTLTDAWGGRWNQRETSNGKCLSHLTFCSFYWQSIIRSRSIGNVYLWWRISRSMNHHWNRLFFFEVVKKIIVDISDRIECRRYARANIDIEQWNNHC